MATRCKSCGAPIRWIKMASGKSMPVNPDQVVYWWRPGGAAGKVVTPNGEVLSCDFDGELEKATGVGYIPHWATCPNADQHRKG